jgi:hypothetical protein
MGGMKTHYANARADDFYEICEMGPKEIGCGIRSPYSLYPRYPNGLLSMPMTTLFHLRPFKYYPAITETKKTTQKNHTE